MKKLIVAGVVLVASSSCKKQYTCECSSKVSWSVSGASSSKEVVHKEAMSEKMKEKQATSACTTVEAQTKKHVEEQVKESYNGTGINPSISTTCKLM